MIPLGKVNEAYDTLNLPRDASLQTVRDRFNVLKARLAGSDDTARLVAIEDAFNTIEISEEAKRAQREAATGHIRTRSERDLDGTLQRLTAQTGGESHGTKRSLEPVVEEAPKKLKEEVKTEEGKATSNSDEIVFDKLGKLLKDESKYLRAVNVLHGIIKSIIDNGDTSDASVERIIGAIEIACSSRGSNGGLPLVNAHEDNRKAMSKVMQVVESSVDLVDRIKAKGYYMRMWQHSVSFRNSLYDLDNFLFSKKCKELIGLVGAIDVGDVNDETERMVLEIELTADVLCSSYISKVIPGRLNEVKNTMTEIYKLTRVKDFPRQFKDRIAEHQKNLASS